MHASPELNALPLPPGDRNLAEHEAALFRWFAKYERMVQARAGLDARTASLDQYGARRVGAAWEIPTRWERLASASTGKPPARATHADLTNVEDIASVIAVH
jgi:hypothetical protein